MYLSTEHIWDSLHVNISARVLVQLYLVPAALVSF